jgi:hypothetical protein
MCSFHKVNKGSALGGGHVLPPNRPQAPFPRSLKGFLSNLLCAILKFERRIFLSAPVQYNSRCKSKTVPALHHKDVLGSGAIVPGILNLNTGLGVMRTWDCKWSLSIFSKLLHRTKLELIRLYNIYLKHFLVSWKFDETESKIISVICIYISIDEVQRN